jgi:hypothetical protein
MLIGGIFMRVDYFLNRAVNHFLNLNALVYIFGPFTIIANNKLQIIPVIAQSIFIFARIKRIVPDTNG